MRLIKDDNIYSEHCPVCGRGFVPAPCHVYRGIFTVGGKRSERMVCSYTCSLRAKEQHECEIAERKRTAHEKKLHGLKLDGTPMKNCKKVFGGEGERSAASKAVVCLDTGERYHSARSAARALGLSESGVASCCRGRYKATKGYHFAWAKETEE